MNYMLFTKMKKKILMMSGVKIPLKNKRRAEIELKKLL
jgi:hypothetical protein